MRTKKTLRNFIISTILTTLVALIGLVKIKVFLNYLGDEATGIYQLFSQILSYISLVDAGLTSSILYCLYKPVSEKDDKKINAILKGGRNFYSIVAILIIIIGIIISLKIDFFLSDYSISLTYIKICFILFILASSINYFVTPEKVILEARQNIYKVHLIVYGSMIIKSILEIILLTLHLKLMSLMLLFVIISILQNTIIIITARKDYKQLSLKKVKPDNTFRKETKNLIVQKIATVIFNNIDIILISKFISPATVVIYTSYMYIINSLQNILKRIGSSTLASVGNLLVTEKEKARNIFCEYNAMCYYIANIICVPLLIAISPFVSVFYGNKYTLPYLGSVCVVAILYFKVIEMPLDTYNAALGYFKKIRNCVIFQSILNLSLSFYLLFKIGIVGILIATVVSYFFGEIVLYPMILNKNYFKDKKVKYYSTSFKLFIISILSYALIYSITKNIAITNLFSWFLLGLGSFIVNFILTTVYFKMINQIEFFERFKPIIKDKLKKIKEGIKNEKN